MILYLSPRPTDSVHMNPVGVENRLSSSRLGFRCWSIAEATLFPLLCLDQSCEEGSQAGYHCDHE